jgi:hypothetical protein
MYEKNGKLKIANCRLQIENWWLRCRFQSHAANLQFAFCNPQFAIRIAAQRPLLPGVVPDEA